ncbi:MAG TPA: radical SAM protein [Candidatus Angelobacter sp.]|nr:radical SAM protein [Candidatus Angelobacter sp.]
MLKNLHIYLIKPTLYDDEGYPVRHWRGVLPSNTLACLTGLTEEVVRQKKLGAREITIHVLDETVDRVAVDRICRSQRAGKTQTIIGLVGVQTNQFPRAADLARAFRRAGLTVMIGGFHVTGYLNLMPTIPPDIQDLMDEGVTIVKGEVEEVWGDLLLDAVNGRLKPLYDFTHDKPDLTGKPLPVIRKEYLHKFAASNFGTLDCGRGCPFACSFCTIINVQGRIMRFRSAEQIAATLRHNYKVHGVTYYFFTDDNFARNHNWEAIFDALIHMREEEHIPIDFMMQVDVLSWKIPHFIAKAGRAGCSSVFIGMESLNPDSLKEAGKKQNHVEEYPKLMEAYRAAGISTHVGYIIGFPNDTVDSVRRDLAQLIEKVCPDHASFFMLTPLPGSQDHMTLLRRGEWMHPDFNLYDSFHAVTRHPNLRDGSWEELYREAWRAFYSFDNLRAILRRSPRREYWNNLKRFFWYKNSIETEDRHPMVCGFFRLKGRRERRAGYPILSRGKYAAYRLREIRLHLAAMIRLLFTMEELWLQTRQRGDAEQRVVEELRRIRATAHGRMRLADLQLAYRQTKAQFPALRIPSKLQLSRNKWFPLLAPGTVLTRADLDTFWHTFARRWRERSWLHIPSPQLACGLFRDVQISLIFLSHLARAD